MAILTKTFGSAILAFDCSKDHENFWRLPSSNRNTLCNNDNYYYYELELKWRALHDLVYSMVLAGDIVLNLAVG